MVTHRCGSGRERALKEPSASDVCADVRTFACVLTMRCICRQKLDRSATAHWRGQVAISTAVRRRVALMSSRCAKRAVIAFEIHHNRVYGYSVRCGLSFQSLTSLRYLIRFRPVIASAAKQSILSLCRDMDCFAALAMTVDIVSPSRGAHSPRFASSFALLENQRAQGRPGARCTRGLACNCAQRTRTRAYRFSGNTPAFPAQWLYGLLRALPGERLSCHRRSTR